SEAEDPESHSGFGRTRPQRTRTRDRASRSRPEEIATGGPSGEIRQPPFGKPFRTSLCSPTNGTPRTRWGSLSPERETPLCRYNGGPCSRLRSLLSCPPPGRQTPAPEGSRSGQAVMGPKRRIRLFV